MSVRLQIVGMEKVGARLRHMPKACELYVRGYAQLVKTAMRKTIPRGKQHIHPKSKRQRRTIVAYKTVQVLSNRGAGVMATAVVGTPIAHARYFTFGTPPHVIQYRRAKILVYYKSGARSKFERKIERQAKGKSAPGYLKAAAATIGERDWVFAKRVMHPGTKPNDWRDRALASVSEADKQNLWTRAITKGEPVDIVGAP